MDLKVDELDALGAGEVGVHLGRFVAAAGVNGGFECGDAGETPLGVGEGLDEFRFARAGGLVILSVSGQVLAVGFCVVGGQEDGAAGESGLDRVHRGDAFAFGGAGAAGSDTLFLGLEFLQSRIFFDEFELLLV